jgi:uncharacterized membrane protein YdjX (TVP38/TMEM64 family)
MPQGASRFKKKTFVAWLVLVAVVLSLYFTNRETIDVDLVRRLVHENKLVVVPAYLLLLSSLGLIFIPSTPFAFAGVLLFHPEVAYVLNLVGIVTSSTVVYHFARFLGLRQGFERRYPGKLQKVQAALENKELPIMVGWSFFPVVPTDLIIYVASTLRIPLWKCILGVLIGEGTLNAVYIFSANLAL